MYGEKIQHLVLLSFSILCVCLPDLMILKMDMDDNSFIQMTIQDHEFTLIPADHHQNQMNSSNKSIRSCSYENLNCMNT